MAFGAAGWRVQTGCHIKARKRPHICIRASHIPSFIHSPCFSAARLPLTATADGGERKSARALSGSTRVIVGGSGEDGEGTGGWRGDWGNEEGVHYLKLGENGEERWLWWRALLR